MSSILRTSMKRGHTQVTIRVTRYIMTRPLCFGFSVIRLNRLRQPFNEFLAYLDPDRVRRHPQVLTSPSIKLTPLSRRMSAGGLGTTVMAMAGYWSSAEHEGLAFTTVLRCLLHDYMDVPMFFRRRWMHSTT